MASINPYASPQATEYEPPLPEVGVWRDGELMVMHLSAILPSICVKTGKQAEHYSDVTIRWVQNFIPWRITVKVPLTWTAFRAAIVTPVAAFVVTLIITAALVGVLSLFREEPILLILLIAVLAVATIVMGFRALNALGSSFESAAVAANTFGFRVRVLNSYSSSRSGTGSTYTEVKNAA